jgi:thymidylate synthase (FAD)
MSNYKTNVLDHGFVILRNLAGPTRRVGEGSYCEGSDGENVGYFEQRPFDADDTDPANAARMSFEGMDKDVVALRDGSTRPRTVEDDHKLNEYLLVNKHTSPFEMIQVWVEVKVPIFVDRQLVRHRTWRRSEASARYTVLPAEWYIPQVVGGKAPNKKQGQEDNLSEQVQESFKLRLRAHCCRGYNDYLEAMEDGVAPEHARMFLSLNHYVHWLGNVDLHNMFHFLSLRTHSHAQIEAQRYGFAIVDLLRPHLPQLMSLFDKHCRRP